MFWYNGELIHASTLELAIDDPGLLYGATVFTTLRVYHRSLDSALTNWKAHCDRLANSLQTFGWLQPDWHRLRQGAQVMLAQFPVLRITVFPDGREWIVGRLVPENLPERQQHGVSAIVATALQFNRCLPAHKTGNYLSAWLAGAKARQMSAGEAILVDENGNWLETSTGNLWGWRDGNWWTPPLSAGILPGVVRSQLKQWLSKHELPVRELPWLANDVKQFEAIAYSNSVVEVVPIHTIQQTTHLHYDPHHPCFKQLRGFFVV